MSCARGESVSFLRTSPQYGELLQLSTTPPGYPRQPLQQPRLRRPMYHRNVPTKDLQPVPMLDFTRQFSTLREEVMQAIEAVCVSQKFILGPAVESFEAAAALACGAEFGIGCASGTDALWLAPPPARLGPRRAPGP